MWPCPTLLDPHPQVRIVPVVCENKVIVPPYGVSVGGRPWHPVRLARPTVIRCGSRWSGRFRCGSRWSGRFGVCCLLKRGVGSGCERQAPIAIAVWQQAVLAMCAGGVRTAGTTAILVELFGAGGSFGLRPATSWRLYHFGCLQGLQPITSI